jgi:hypothetical protein
MCSSWIQIGRRGIAQRDSDVASCMHTSVKYYNAKPIAKLLVINYTDSIIIIIII